MSISFNGTDISAINYNGTSLSKVIYNGTEVWSSYTVVPTFYFFKRNSDTETVLYKLNDFNSSYPQAFSQVTTLTEFYNGTISNYSGRERAIIQKYSDRSYLYRSDYPFSTWAESSTGSGKPKIIKSGVVGGQAMFLISTDRHTTLSDTYIVSAANGRNWASTYLTDRFSGTPYADNIYITNDKAFFVFHTVNSTSPVDYNYKFFVMDNTHEYSPIERFNLSNYKNVYGMCYKGGTYFVYAEEVSGQMWIHTSTNLSAWTGQYFNYYFTEITCNSSSFFAYDSSNNIYFSADGLTWEMIFTSSSTIKKMQICSTGVLFMASNGNTYFFNNNGIIRGRHTGISSVTDSDVLCYVE